jgi:hypothetical protein
MPEGYHRDRLPAAAFKHSGSWLHVLHLAACDLHLDNEAVRMAVGLRLAARCVNLTNALVANWSMRVAFTEFPTDVAPADSLAMITPATLYSELSRLPEYLPPNNPSALSMPMANGLIAQRLCHGVKDGQLPGTS